MTIQNIIGILMIAVLFLGIFIYILKEDGIKWAFYIYGKAILLVVFIAVAVHLIKL